MSLGKIEKISKVTRQMFEPELAVIHPNQELFDSMMNKKALEATVSDSAVQKETLQESSKTTVFDAAKEIAQSNKISHVSFSSLQSQTEEALAQVDELRSQLQTPDVEIKTSFQNILQDKLTHIDQNVKIAVEQVGGEYSPATKVSSFSGPAERFLGLLTHSQGQLENLSGYISSMSKDGKTLSAANMLLLQIKVGQVQQEIELFTSLLNKSLESTKTIMNVQV